MRRLIIAMLAGGLLSACGASAVANLTASKGGPNHTAAPTASQTPGRYLGTPPPITRHHSNLNMSQPVHQDVLCGDYPAGGPPTLAETIQAVQPTSAGDRAAVVATLVSIGTAVWNTPDGHRWTQAEINAGTAVPPSVYTPFVLQVQRVLGNTTGLTVGQTITGYLNGGQTPYGDLISACQGAPIVTPQPGWSVVAIFGGEVDTPTMSAVPRRPIIWELDIIKDGAVQTQHGSQPIP